MVRTNLGVGLPPSTELRVMYAPQTRVVVGFAFTAAVLVPLGCPASFTTIDPSDAATISETTAVDAMVGDAGEQEDGATAHVDSQRDSTEPSDSGFADTGTTPDTGGPFTSTPGSIDCNGTRAAPFDGGANCCPWMGGWVASGGSCFVDGRWECEEKVDCPSTWICCGKSGGAVCQNPSLACPKQYCTQHSECPSGKCIESIDGPCTKPHGVCAP